MGVMCPAEACLPTPGAASGRGALSVQIGVGCRLLRLLKGSTGCLVFLAWFAGSAPTSFHLWHLPRLPGMSIQLQDSASIGRFVHNPLDEVPKDARGVGFLPLGIELCGRTHRLT